MSVNKGKVELTKYSKDGDKQSFEYLIEQNNGSTSVEQTLTISSVDEFMGADWVAALSLGDFPQQKTPEEAAQKMADWLERLAAAIREGEYHNFKRARLTDLGI